MSALARASTSTSRATAARVGLVLVAIPQAEIGIWGLLAPSSFFHRFPGFGHHWVAALGTYNEHLVRDYAAAELGVAVLLLLTALWFERRLAIVACSAFLAATVPHFAYHLTTTESFSSADNIASLGGFMLEIAVVLAVLIVAGASDRREH